MRKIIVTTTINPPTEALEKFMHSKWQIIVVGDLKTPHEAYKNLDVIYMSPEDQEKKYPGLSKTIGWNCIQRRSMGFVEAYRMGADIVATVDDDNIPYPNWGQNLMVGQEMELDCYHTELPVFDPLSVTTCNQVWHRGFPIELIPKRLDVTKSRVKRKILVQADLWDGDPDVDAIGRIAFAPKAEFRNAPFCSDKMSPFNSQNTFMAREVIPHYLLFPHCGRMDDIWASYVLQDKFPGCVAYGTATVFQKRNKHNLAKDLEDEMLGYKYNLQMVNDIKNYKKLLPPETLPFIDEYERLFK